MNAKLTSDGSGRDQYMIQAMRDFEANSRAGLSGYRAQFKTTQLRDYSFEDAERWSEPRRRCQSATFRSTIFSWEGPARGGAPPEAPVEGYRLAGMRKRQHSTCCRLSVPSSLHREQRRFSVEQFMQGN
eukprot:TRINITY_DN7576_c0_g1_i2.p1 TRINITY_DN7576_c0_g1~~TRINITY_DN7576_c0_g1_i2.p1  ORF type:complete len:129 (+),score=15.57 TRINITY_DN7576_c0_g1_i2:74-460(+)